MHLHTQSTFLYLYHDHISEILGPGPGPISDIQSRFNAFHIIVRFDESKFYRSNTTMKEYLNEKIMCLDFLVHGSIEHRLNNAHL